VIVMERHSRGPTQYARSAVVTISFCTRE